MPRDPVVEEIHQIRRRLLEECHGDFDRYCERLKELASDLPNPRVSRKRRTQRVAQPK